MVFRRLGRSGSAARSWIAVGLVLFGLALGGLWALTLIGLAIDGLVRIVPWRFG